MVCGENSKGGLRPLRPLFSVSYHSKSKIISYTCEIEMILSVYIMHIIYPLSLYIYICKS